MILFVKTGCDFCKDLPEVKGLRTFDVVQRIGGPKMLIEGRHAPLPKEIIGLPALLIGSEIYIGREHVEMKVKELAEKAA